MVWEAFRTIQELFSNSKHAQPLPSLSNPTPFSSPHMCASCIPPHKEGFLSPIFQMRRWSLGEMEQQKQCQKVGKRHFRSKSHGCHAGCFSVTCRQVPEKGAVHESGARNHRAYRWGCKLSLRARRGRAKEKRNHTAGGPRHVSCTPSIYMCSLFSLHSNWQGCKNASSLCVRGWEEGPPRSSFSQRAGLFLSAGSMTSPSNYFGTKV